VSMVYEQIILIPFRYEIDNMSQYLIIALRYD
jgi:hypothetical protein